MVSVASRGTDARINARILFKVLRAGSGTAARYSSTFFAAALPFAAERRLPAFAFVLRTMTDQRSFLMLRCGMPAKRPVGSTRSSWPTFNSGFAARTAETLAIRARATKAADISGDQRRDGRSTTRQLRLRCTCLERNTALRAPSFPAPPLIR